MPGEKAGEASVNFGSLQRVFLFHGCLKQLMFVKGGLRWALNVLRFFKKGS